jgi:peptidyl-prolyl cis-trans isomerase D
VQTQLAQKRYSEAAVDFSNMVEDQSDSLKPVADKYKLALRTAQDVHRTAAPGATGELANPKFLEALFGTDAVRNKRNTQAIEIAPSTMASGRIVKYEAAHQLPLGRREGQGTRARGGAASGGARAQARRRPGSPN